MIRAGDRVLVGVSGGKDSMLLLYILKELKKDFELAAFHLDLSIEGFSSPSLEVVQRTAEEWNVPLVVYSLSEKWGMGLGEIAGRLGWKPCSLCGLLKRYYLLRTAKEEGFNVVATGHNLDDVLSFYLYNAGTGNVRYFSSLRPLVKTALGIRKVKPLFYLDEKRIERYVKELSIPYYSGKCPFSSEAPTKKIRDFLNEMEEYHPGFKKTLLRFFLKYPVQESSPSKLCKICGMPSSSSICSVCRIKKRLRINPIPY
jgi:uncharacterized protein (TIGR00269 family)